MSPVPPLVGRGGEEVDRAERGGSAARERGKRVEEGWRGEREGGRERFSANNVNHTPEGKRGGLCASPPCRVTLEAAKERGRERERAWKMKDEKGRGESRRRE